MTRRITGRCMDIREEASSFHYSVESHWCESKDKVNDSCDKNAYIDNGQSQARYRCWPMEKLTKVLPSVSTSTLSTTNDTSTDDFISSSMDIEDDFSHDDGFLYKELSVLYEKWSDEDGVEETCNRGISSEKSKKSAQDSALFHSEMVFEENRFYLQRPPVNPQLPDNSMAITFDHLSLMPSTERPFLKTSSSVDEKTDLSSDSKTSLATSAASLKSFNNRYCVFCKKNGETQEFYISHVIKDSKGHVICPILRDYVCPVCKATGSSAHTMSYCPLLRKDRGRMLSVYNKPVCNAGLRNPKSGYN